jgi:hypothetical protein
VAGAATSFTSIQVTIASGGAAQRRATRSIELRDEDGMLRLDAHVPAAMDEPD